MVLPCRIACLRIPRFQIVAHLKAEPALKSQALALLSGTGNRAKVLLCSKEASLQRVYPGMKFSEAKAVCANLLWREYDESLYKRLESQIVQRLVMASPQISSLDNGNFLLDASGLTHLGGENKFCRLVQKLVNTAGFPEMQIGIADTAFAAQVASKYKRSKYCIVPAGKDKEFLAALSVQHMPISADMQETLISLGIKTIGQLLQIPGDELHERFGREGLLALDLAEGVDKTQPQIVIAPELYESSVDLNFPVESLDQTKFILKSMLESICSKLKERGLLAEELNISFFNDNDKFNERPLKLLRPSNNTKFLLELIKLSLEATPLLREYTGIHVEVTQTQIERWTQNKVKIVKPGMSLLKGLPQKQSATTSSTSFAVESNNNDAQAEPFALLLQRFVTRLGSKSVLRPVANDQHIPELAASFQPLVEKTDSVLPISINFGNSEAGASALACGLILKKSSNPDPVMVEYQGKTPTSITYQGRWHKIKELTEPERLSGLWWDKPVRK
ncbi:MAG: DNA polymerase Y family protein, partial [Candidatus Obscuribacterales bacterium]|nr:DNA polymerase Y family protein [Candidatus Obscuribacterales bacterium]